jgi:Zn-dependent M28 family amino/carboxypeptidase
LQKKGARAVLYYDPANYQRYQRAFDYLSTNESGKMSLKKDDGDMALVLLQENMATSIYPMIAQSSKATTLSTTIDFDVRSNNEAISSENVVAFIKGSKKPNEYLIISSHLDHIGIGANGKINNGADDDGSGTVAMLEIAEAFKQAAKAGQGPERSVVFLHVTGEEKGLLGSEYYADVDPIFPLSETVADLNIDMIGRTDPKRAGSKEYVYLIGSDKLSTELHQLSEKINDTYTHLELDYKYNDENEPNRFYYRSDHYNFAKNGIPIIFYFNGTHDDYHRPSDTPDKIDYDLLEKRARLIFYTAWELANRPQRVIVDKSTR